MSTTTNVEQVKLNIMTQQQYDSATKSATELYMITDATTVADKLGLTSVGSVTQPIYLNNGVPTATTYSLATSVPVGAVFTDTLNTAGATDTSSKIYLVGATSQDANPQTYSHDTVFVDTDGALNSVTPTNSDNSTKVVTTAWINNKGVVTEGSNGSHSLKGYNENGTAYSDLELYKYVYDCAHSTYDSTKFTKVSTPTVTDDGIAYNFANGRYIRANQTIDCTKPFRVTANEKRGSNSLFAGFSLNQTNNVAYPLVFCQQPSSSYMSILYYLNGTLTSHDCQFNTALYSDIDYVISWDGETYLFEIRDAITQETIVHDTLSSSVALKRNNVSSAYAIYGWQYNVGRGMFATDLRRTRIDVEGVPVWYGCKLGSDTIKVNDYTLLGAPTITDGVASDFTNSNRVLTPINQNLGLADTWKIEAFVTLPSSLATRYFMTGANSSSDYRGFVFGIDSTGKLRNYLSSNGTSWNIASALLSTTAFTAGSTIGIRCEFTGTSYVFSTKQSGGDWTVQNTVSSSVRIFNTNSPITIGSNTNASNSTYWTGSVDLNSVKIYANGQLIYTSDLTIPYSIADNGSKVADVIYSGSVSEAYHEKSDFQYFVIDEINKTASLPYGDIYGLMKNDVSDRVIGEIVTSTIPLYDSGLHLLDGSLLSGNGIYGAFVNYIADLYNEDPTTACFMQDNVITKYGSLTDTSNVLSGFSSSNYAVVMDKNFLFSPGNSSWEVVFKITTGSNVTDSQFICASVVPPISRYAGLDIIIRNGHFGVVLGTDGRSSTSTAGTYTVAASTTYWVKAAFNGSSSYTLSYSTNGTSFTTDITVNSSDVIYQNNYILLGVDYDETSYNSPFLGSIDLSGSYIKVGTNTLWSGTMTPEDKWQYYTNYYGSCGKFVYNSMNNTVRLPKIEGFVEGTSIVETIGDLTQAGLPNILGTIRSFRGSSGSSAEGHGGFRDCFGAFTTADSENYQYIGLSGTSTSDTAYGSVAFKASLSNYIYGNNDKVQPQSIKLLYYIVIATVTKTDVEIDMGKITTDLSLRANRHLSNILDTQSSNFDGQWVNKYLDLATSTTYPASTDTIYSLSSYLPADNYDYEVLVRGNVTTGSASSNFLALLIRSDIILTSMYLCGCRTRTTSSVNAYGFSTIPVGTLRQLIVTSNSSYTGTYALSVAGYRRIGTNT